MSRRSGSAIREAIEALLIAVIFMNFARIFVFQAFKIPSESMEQTLLVGDHLIVNKFVFGSTREGEHPILPFSNIARGDLVVFRYPEDPDVDFVKRVIALPGETIEIANKRVWIDGRQLEEPYLFRNDKERVWRRDDFGPLTLEDDEFFVMGDNRDESNDSRYWGPVPRRLIQGRPWMIYWSFDGHPPPEGSPFSERLDELAYVVTHFMSHTRWERTMIAVPAEKPRFSFNKS